MMSSIKDDAFSVSDEFRTQVIEWIRNAGTQKDVAPKLGVSVPTLQRIIAGTAPIDIDVFCAAASLAGFDPMSFLKKKVAIREAATKPYPPVRDEMHISEVDLAYGMGATFVDDLNATEVVRVLPTDWVRQFTRAPAEKLFLCRGIGDSMFPTLFDSDMLLVDTSQQRPKQSDRIWVMSVGEMGMVKRLRVRADGNYVLLSDNAQVPDMDAVDGEMAVIGRVVAVIRKM